MTNPKLRVYQNDTILGPYDNKKQCFMKATTDWVAVLDSNNLFDAEFFDSFFTCIERQGEKRKTVYYSGITERFLPLVANTENRTAHFNGMAISRANWNTILEMREWKVLLNSGNMVWPTKVRRHFQEFPSKYSNGIANILFIRQAIQAGYRLSIEPTLHYVFTVIDDPLSSNNENDLNIFTASSMSIV